MLHVKSNFYQPVSSLTKGITHLDINQLTQLSAQIASLEKLKFENVASRLNPLLVRAAETGSVYAVCVIILESGKVIHPHYLAKSFDQELLRDCQTIT
jgi:hypothetical protein